MFSLTRYRLATSLAFLLVFALAGFVVADEAIDASGANAQVIGYQVSVWRNDTPITIQGDFQWGDAPWQHFVVHPGGTYFAYHPNYLVPPLGIRFDADPGPGLTFRQYRLRTYYSVTTVLNDGPTEVFIIQPNGLVDIVRTRI